LVVLWRKTLNSLVKRRRESWTNLGSSSIRQLLEEKKILLEFQGFTLRFSNKIPSLFRRKKLKQIRPRKICREPTEKSSFVGDTQGNFKTTLSPDGDRISSTTLTLRLPDVVAAGWFEVDPPDILKVIGPWNA
jgi:hypothetical protein